MRQTFASLLYYLTRQSTVSNRAITLFYQQGFPKTCIVLASHVKGKVFDAKEHKSRGQLNFQTELLAQRQVEQSIITSETPDSMHRHHMTLWYRWPVYLTKLSWKCAWTFPHHPVNAIWPERSHNQRWNCEKSFLKNKNSLDYSWIQVKINCRHIYEILKDPVGFQVSENWILACPLGKHL